MLEDGIIEPAPEVPTGPMVSYSPHQPVLRNDHATTKLRIVFDACVSVPKDHSLNDCLFRGPIHIPGLTGILLRFRQADIILLADIEKAFLQIELNTADRDSTRFLWISDPHKPISAKK